MRRRPSGTGDGLALELCLIPADLLAGQPELLGDLLLLDALRAGIADGLAKCKARLLDPLARSNVGASGGYDIRHRIRHLPIMARTWPLPMMPQILRQRNLLRCHVT